jgi:hypothetical protein
MLKEFFEIYNIEIKPDVEYVLNNLNEFVRTGKPVITVKINQKIENITKKDIIKVPKGSEFKIISVQGSRGLFPVPDDINLNLESFYIRNYITFHVKNDFENVFDFVIRAV